MGSVSEACRQWRCALAAAALGQLGEAERTALGAHAEGCGPCRAELAQLGLLARALPAADPDRERIVRIVAGLALIATGGRLRGAWIVFAVVGLLPLAAGVFDLCVLGPLFRLPFVGPRFRQAMVAR